MPDHQRFRLHGGIGERGRVRRRAALRSAISRQREVAGRCRRSGHERARRDQPAIRRELRNRAMRPRRDRASRVLTAPRRRGRRSAARQIILVGPGTTARASGLRRRRASISPRRCHGPARSARASSRIAAAAARAHAKTSSSRRRRRCPHPTWRDRSSTAMPLSSAQPAPASASASLGQRADAGDDGVALDRLAIGRARTRWPPSSDRLDARDRGTGDEPARPPPRGGRRSAPASSAGTARPSRRGAISITVASAPRAVRLARQFEPDEAAADDDEPTDRGAAGRRSASASGEGAEIVDILRAGAGNGEAAAGGRRSRAAAGRRRAGRASRASGDARRDRSRRASVPIRWRHAMRRRAAPRRGYAAAAGSSSPVSTAFDSGGRS